MRIGSCLLMLASEEDPLARGSIALIRQAGYDYAEVPLARLFALDEEELHSYYDLFVQHGLPVEVFNCSIPDGLALIGPGADPNALQAYIERAIAIATLMGVKVIAMCGPTRDSMVEDFTWDVGFTQYVAFVRRYADVAHRAGITLAIEPINSEENGFISTISEALRVIDACQRDNVKVIVDFYHFFQQNDDWDTLLQACQAGVVHAHYATKTVRTYPLAKDTEECKAVLAPFLDSGYSGCVSIEAHTAHPEQDLLESCALLRELFA